MLLALLRFPLVCLLAALLSMPALTPPGALFFLIIVFSAIALGSRLIDLRVLPMLFICGYSVALALIYSRSDFWFLKANSAEMRQAGALLLAVLVCHLCRHKELIGLILLVFLVSIVGLLLEIAGSNPHDFIYVGTRSEHYYQDASFYGESEQRYRAFFTESSVLMGALTCLGIAVLVGFYDRYRLGRRPSWYVVALLSMYLFASVTVLTKSGFAVLGFAVICLLVGVFFHGSITARIRMLALVLIVCFTIPAIFLLLPLTLQEYFMTELRAVPSALRGDWEAIPESGGLATRIQFWILAIDVFLRQPWGTSLPGTEALAITSQVIQPTPEMNALFANEVWGMKNTVANVISQTGLPGMIALGISLYMLFRPTIDQDLQSKLGSLFLFGACFGFLLSIESYYNWALIYLCSAVVSRFRADASI